jgi:5-hydroxyisourate hydrolase-like protein (transthyretin family)
MTHEDAERPRWRRLLINRFVAVLAALAAATGLWNGYVALHDHGIVSGRVVDAAGHPVAGATVVLWVLNFTTFVETARVTTDADGRFVIINRNSHHIQLSAEKPGAGRSARVDVRLYFRAQDVALGAPLVL